MKKFIFLILNCTLFVLFTSCGDGSVKSDSVQSVNIDVEKANISELLDKLAAATEKGNLAMIEKIWSPNSNTLLLGTESNEKLEGWEAIKGAIGNQTTSFEETLISISDQNIWVSEDGRTAWFYEELNYNFILNDKAMSFDGIRFTGVFSKNEKGEWKLVQGHNSIPSNMQAQE